MPEQRNMSVECIGLTPNNSPYSEESIAALLLKQRINTEHGGTYTGRPVTELITTDDCVIKFRTEYKLEESEARRFIEQAIKRERNIGIHHPDKTWFLIFNQGKSESNEVNIANITPLLFPLHQHETILANRSAESYLDLIFRCIELYLTTASGHEISIDLGLSNFGVNDNDQVFYLDDDFYRWNNFQDLPEFLANLIRSFDFLDEHNIARLGTRIRTAILTLFNDSHWLTVIAEELRSVFIPEQRETLRQALIESLYATETFHYQPRETHDVIAIIADIHANAPALNTALKYLQQRNITHTLVLGDIVGYGPHPKQCIDMLDQDTGFSIIRGNHDHAVATGNAVAGATSLAGWTLNWTIENLDNQAKQWLAALPCYLQHENWLAVHGSPRDKTFFNGYVYQMNYTENLDELQSRNIPLCFHGHTHVQKIYYRQRGVDDATDTDVAVLKNMSHALLCPGSIGQPRSGKPGVELAIINTETLELEFQRLSYDMEQTINDMTRYNFPPGLMDRLRSGT